MTSTDIKEEREQDFFDLLDDFTLLDILELADPYHMYVTNAVCRRWAAVRSKPDKVPSRKEIIDIILSKDDDQWYQLIRKKIPFKELFVARTKARKCCTCELSSPMYCQCLLPLIADIDSPVHDLRSNCIVSATKRKHYRCADIIFRLSDDTPNDIVESLYMYYISEDDREGIGLLFLHARNISGVTKTKILDFAIVENPNVANILCAHGFTPNFDSVIMAIRQATKRPPHLHQRGECLQHILSHYPQIESEYVRILREAEREDRFGHHPILSTVQNILQRAGIDLYHHMPRSQRDTCHASPMDLRSLGIAQPNQLPSANRRAPSHISSYKGGENIPSTWNHR